MIPIETITSCSTIQTNTIPILSSACYSIGLSYSISKKYRCSYCDTIHENNIGICNQCGAPLSRAIEVL